MDISQAIKMPPLPGQSRSLLHFTPQIKNEYGTPATNAVNNKNGVVVPASAPNAVDNAELLAPAAASNAAADGKKFAVMGDHDYFEKSAKAAVKKSVASVAATEDAVERKGKISYIEEDAPPEGYGPGKNKSKLMGDVVERRINVTAGHKGMRTVVLHVPKDIK